MSLRDRVRHGLIFTAVLASSAAVIGCETDEAGTITLSDSMRRSGAQAGFGQAVGKGKTESLGPGDYQGGPGIPRKNARR